MMHDFDCPEPAGRGRCTCPAPPPGTVETPEQAKARLAKSRRARVRP